MSQGDIRVFHIQGLLPRRRNGVLRINGEGVTFFWKGGNFPAAWPAVESVAFDDPGRTRANLGALAVFGPLAIGSRVAFTLITVSANGSQSYFESNHSIGVWRATVQQIWNDVPEIRGKLYLEGQAVVSRASAAATQPQDDVPAQIKALADLRDQGILTVEEFQHKKTELLGRM
jgi:hypothetical protein